LISSFGSKNKVQDWYLLKTLVDTEGAIPSQTTIDPFNVIETSLKMNFAKEFNLLNIENLEEKTKQISPRNPFALIVYNANLNKYGRKGEYLKVKPLLEKSIIGVLEGTYPEIRYNDNKHLKTVFKGRDDLKNLWEAGDIKKASDLSIITNINEPYNKDWKVLDTDRFEDLLLMGEEVKGSCQSLIQKDGINVCLTAYIKDGKIRVVGVQDAEGHYIGRAVLRILWDPENNKPVLFREKFYINNQNSNVAELIRAECLQRAKTLGLPLVSKSDLAGKEPQQPIYDADVESLDGCPFEYVDALKGKSPPEYKISGSTLIYQP
jgi:hypothetical protein